MDSQEIKQTSIWQLYEKGRNFHRMRGIYTDTDRNYRMYNGDQWSGVKLGDVEPVQKNFIKPIVKYKLAVIHDNLYAIIYSSQNFENPAFAKEAERYCEMLNRYAARVWEKDKMDFLGRKITKDSAVNDEGILYVWFDEETRMPVNEIVKKNDIYYGNENDDDIQAQPYILIRKRMTVSMARELALREGLTEDRLEWIIGDNDTFEESGDDAKDEVDDNVTVVYKFYKQDGVVYYSVATRWITFTEDVDTGLSLYPIAHFNWEEKEGNARGEGEVRYLIPNQIEVNRTEVRRVITVKYQAYPQKVVDTAKVSNPKALNKVGAVIESKGQAVEDVRKIVGTIQPAQMSPDVKQLQDDLIQMTRELAGAGESVTGDVDVEQTSGRAILAVQQASRAPMTEQKESYKNFIEDVARIWLEFLIAYSPDGVQMEEEVTDANGQKMIRLITVAQDTLKQLQATVKVDVTPRSVYDRFAQEQTIENLFTAGLFNVQKLAELKVYADLLDDDSVAPKQKILEAIELMEKEKERIAQIQMQAQLMKQRVQQFLSEGPDAQAQQIADIEAQQVAGMLGAPQNIGADGAELPQSEEMQAIEESNPDDN